MQCILVYPGPILKAMFRPPGCEAGFVGLHDGKGYDNNQKCQINATGKGKWRNLY
jgi:hypothetical protein